jgi:ribonuclease HI
VVDEHFDLRRKSYLAFSLLSTKEMFPVQRSVLSYFLESTPVPPLAATAATAVTTAAAHPTTIPQEPKISYMDIFCDGACTKNGKKFARAGFGLYVVKDSKPIAHVSEALEPHEIQTNQRAELRALERALEFAAESPKDIQVRIFTDSEYSIFCVTKWAFDWKRHNWLKSDSKDVQHKDIIANAFRLWQSVYSRITIEHVRAHTNKSDWKSLGNKKADELATASIRGSRA